MTNKKYKVIFSCNDCTGEDPMGCFDGGTEAEYYDTLTEAMEAGEKFIKGTSVYKYQIYENDIEIPEDVFEEEWQKRYGIYH